MPDVLTTPGPSTRDWAPRWPVAKYQRLREVGVLTAEDRVELLEGHIMLKEPEAPRHDERISVILALVGPLAPSGWLCRVRQPIILSDSLPEPDLAFVRGSPCGLAAGQPAASDTGLVIEVADTSLLRDQRDKTRIYARAGIPVYWIINLVDRRVEVYSRPSGPAAVPAYGAFQTFQPGDGVPLVLDGNTVATVPPADLLP